MTQECNGGPTDCPAKTNGRTLVTRSVSEGERYRMRQIPDSELRITLALADASGYVFGSPNFQTRHGEQGQQGRDDPEADNDLHLVVSGEQEVIV